MTRTCSLDWTASTQDYTPASPIASSPRLYDTGRRTERQWCEPADVRPGWPPIGTARRRPHLLRPWARRPIRTSATDAGMLHAGGRLLDRIGRDAGPRRRRIFLARCKMLFMLAGTLAVYHTHVSV